MIFLIKGMHLKPILAIDEWRDYGILRDEKSSTRF